MRALLLLCPWVLTASAGALQTLDRPHDPVVLVGAQLGSLVGESPARLVAFRWEAGWVQIPLQVDQRKQVSFAQVYDDFDPQTALTTLAYADASTHCGADPNPSFDGDDELVVMAADAGGPSGAGAAEPAGVISGSGLELRLSDPLNGGEAWVYLFRSLGGLDPAAGVDRVSYAFELLSGSYLATYSETAGPNSEDSIVETASYRTRFRDRWMRRELRLFAGGASGVDVLDRHLFMFAQGVCTRTEKTFSLGQGAFIANLDGPLRAVRSLLGANSGVLSQRDHFFYDVREEIQTIQRVHPITQGGIFALEFTPAATGMTYQNDLMGSAVVIDGVLDTVPQGPLAWELVQGAQGSLAVAQWVDTDISGLNISSYYWDELLPPFPPCSGDAFEYGATGLNIVGAVPNTDPRTAPFQNLVMHRVHHHGAPGMTPALAAQRSLQARTPLTTSVSSYQPSLGTVYCTSSPNSTGQVALLGASGSTSLTASNLVLHGTQLPQQSLGYVIASRVQTLVPGFGGSQGNLCLANPIHRLSGALLQSGASGEVSVPVDSNSLPLGISFQAGETWSFQLWYRDLNPAPVSNTSEGLELVFLP